MATSADATTMSRVEALRLFLLQQSPAGCKALRSFHFQQWAWVDSNYRPQAYQISAERWWAMFPRGLERLSAEFALSFNRGVGE